VPVRKVTKGIGVPVKNKPTISSKITDGSEKSKKASDAAKRNKIGGKVTLTKDQLKRKAANKRKTQFKPSERAQIKALWESGEFTLSELAAKFNRNGDSLSRYFSERGIVKGAKAEEYAKEIERKIFEDLMGDTGKIAKKVKTLKEDYLTRFDIAKKLTHNEIANVQKNKLSMAAALPNLRAIKEYIGILSACRAEEYDLLGVLELESRVEHSDLPELIISELTGKDIERMRLEQLKLTSLDEVEISVEDDDQAAEQDIEDDDNEIIDEF